MQAGDFSISVTADATNNTHSTVINGPDGFQLTDTVSGGGEVLSGTGLPPQGVALSTAGTGNVQYITLTKSSVEAAAVSESSKAGTESASAISAEYDSLTFAVDFTTGTISSLQVDQSVKATTAQSSPSSSPLSIFA